MKINLEHVDDVVQLAETTQRVLNEVAEELIERENGTLPGFSLRVRAYTLDRLAEVYGMRQSAHVLAVDDAMKKYTKRRKNGQGGAGHDKWKATVQQWNTTKAAQRQWDRWRDC